MKPKHKIVEIEWMDAQSWFGNADYVENLKDEKPVHSFSIGYLLYECKEHLEKADLEQRLLGEIKEWKEAIGIEREYREILDIILIACMLAKKLKGGEK